MSAYLVNDFEISFIENVMSDYPAWLIDFTGGAKNKS